MSNFIPLETFDALMLGLGFRKRVHDDHLSYIHDETDTRFYLRVFHEGDLVPASSWWPVRRMLVYRHFLTEDEWDERTRAKSASGIEMESRTDLVAGKRWNSVRSDAQNAKMLGFG